MEWPFDETGEFRGARIDHKDFSGAELRECRLTGLRIVGCEVVDVEIDGWISNVVVNGVDVVPLVEAELDRQHPVRTLLRSDDPGELLAGWSELLTTWDATIVRATALSEAQRQRRVNGEWSIAQTLRHLVFAIDAWFGRAVRGEVYPYHRAGLPPDDMDDLTGMDVEPGAVVTFEEAVELWRGRAATVTDFLVTATAGSLATLCTPVDAPGWPPSEEVAAAAYTHVRCVRVILDETWAHHRFAVRDLEVVEQSGAAEADPTR